MHTYYNEGQGESLFIDGIRMTNPGTYYNNINEFDYNFDFRTKKVRFNYIHFKIAVKDHKIWRFKEPNT